MHSYRLVSEIPGAGAPAEFRAADDNAAIKVAIRLADGAPMQLWQDQRLVLVRDADAEMIALARRMAGVPNG